jgi:hypothetical protein
MAILLTNNSHHGADAAILISLRAFVQCQQQLIVSVSEPTMKPRKHTPRHVPLAQSFS